MDAIEILSKILEIKGLNVKSFSEKIKLKRPQAIYDIQKGKTKNITPTMASKIISVFPEFNKSWLMTGDGEMLKEADNKEKVMTNINTENMTVSDLVKAINNLSEATIINAEANRLTSQAAIINAEANKQTSLNVDRMLSLIEKKESQKNNKKGKEYVQKNGSDDVVQNA